MNSPRRRRCDRRANGLRGGSILVQVSFLLLVLMGLAAVVIDLGIARMTQGFLQASADAATLEGLRQRDALDDAVASDAQRRAAASRFAALVFDEDADSATATNVAYQLGASPVIDTGVGGVNDPAGGLLVTGGPYVPNLQANVGNAEHGDFVAGTFTPRDPLNPGNPDWHAEGTLYQRADFAPAVAGSAPGANAFLTRLRLTNDLNGLDRLDGVSSAGPTLPYLFGLGSGVLSTDDPDTYDPRRDGITIRATAIADARRAVAAGVASDFVRGVFPVGLDTAPTFVPIRRVLAFDDASWRADLAPGAAFRVLVATDGTVTGVPGGVSADVQGLVQPTTGLVRVGDAAAAAAVAGSVLVTPDLAPLFGTGYVALFSSGADPRIVGFGAVRIDLASLGSDGAGNAVLEIIGAKLGSLIAPENASAQPALAADLAFLAAPDPARASLLAPVLAR